MKLRLTCTGMRPLLMHNVRLASPLDPYAKRLKELNSKQAKTDEDRLAMARIEFEGAMYWMEGVGPHVTAAMLRRSLVGGARLFKAGKKVERGVVIADFVLPLIYQGPRDIEGLWNGGDNRFVDIRPVTVARSKVDRCRPIFREWIIEAEVIFDPEVIDFDEVRRAAQLAGQMEGLGDYRELYGRYDVEIEAL